MPESCLLHFVVRWNTHTSKEQKRPVCLCVLSSRRSRAFFSGFGLLIQFDSHTAAVSNWAQVGAAGGQGDRKFLLFTSYET